MGTPRSTPGSAEADLASILDHHHTATSAPGPLTRAGEHGSLTQGTTSWAALGAIPAPTSTPTSTPMARGSDPAATLPDAAAEVTS